jgi:hypothetical protein
MSKEGLEALERLKNTLLAEGYWQDVLQDVAIVEQELKEYEEMKAIKGTTTFDKAIEDTLINACPNVAKKLKALEIIKNILNIQILGDYLVAQKGETFVAENLKLKQSQEIINLLKEVLKDE